ncbi:hypothetical protein LUX29_02570 [Aureimonas altamirensis]|uniref:hypothetical protein n=1 Tax=Aureimonas altamirensis TaxID=370622 RepID=UPI001E5CB608|nr:hypothetical protein [Aureimonas altamirensis]UHD46146.1 hypothetical protein LUX29_02570 [Aureimonas altamirensis]
MNRPRSSGLAAAITVYRPDYVALERLAGVLAGCTERIYVYIDGPTGEAIDLDGLAIFEGHDAFHIIQSTHNVGIAAGLNKMAAAAIEDGFKRLVFFDQDSDVEPRLPQALEAALTEIGRQGYRPAAVGPKPTAAEPQSKAPSYRPTGRRTGAVEEVAYLIVSGCCLDLSAYAAVGPFRQDLRMDGVDLEWSFRARSRGYSLWCDTASIMPHRVGNGVVRLGPVAFPRQKAARMLNYVYSQALLLRLAHVPTSWKLRSMIYVPLQVLAYALKSPSSPGFVGRAIDAARSGFAAGGKR